MADASAVFTLDKTKTDVTMRTVTYHGSIAIDAAPDTWPSGGITVDLAVAGVLQREKPIAWNIQPHVGLFGVKYVPGSSQSNGKIVIYGYTPTDATAGVLPFTEYTAGDAIPAAVSGYSFPFSFTVRKGK